MKTKNHHKRPLDISERMLLFKAVVEQEDAGVDYLPARTRTAKRFGVPIEQVEQVIKQGLRDGWLEDLDEGR